MEKTETTYFSRSNGKREMDLSPKGEGADPEQAYLDARRLMLSGQGSRDDAARAAEAYADGMDDDPELQMRLYGEALHLSEQAASERGKEQSAYIWLSSVGNIKTKMARIKGADRKEGLHAAVESFRRSIEKMPISMFLNGRKEYYVIFNHLSLGKLLAELAEMEGERGGRKDYIERARDIMRPFGGTMDYLEALIKFAEISENPAEKRSYLEEALGYLRRSLEEGRPTRPHASLLFRALVLDAAAQETGMARREKLMEAWRAVDLYAAYGDAEAFDCRFAVARMWPDDNGLSLFLSKVEDALIEVEQRKADEGRFRRIKLSFFLGRADRRFVELVLGRYDEERLRPDWADAVAEKELFGEVLGEGWFQELFRNVPRERSSSSHD